MGQLQQGSKKGAFSRTQPWNMRYRQAAEEARGSTTARAHDDRVFKASLAVNCCKCLTRLSQLEGEVVRD
ncbi:hypothetical protein OEZ86_008675 [Tetradesmus obliquus]|nr:hypothetical protein OEZ86_008675 [Tetradesmus obliquus]